MESSRGRGQVRLRAERTKAKTASHPGPDPSEDNSGSTPFSWGGVAPRGHDSSFADFASAPRAPVPPIAHRPRQHHNPCQESWLNAHTKLEHRAFTHATEDSRLCLDRSGKNETLVLVTNASKLELPRAHKIEVLSRAILPSIFRQPYCQRFPGSRLSHYGLRVMAAKTQMTLKMFRMIGRSVSMPSKFGCEPLVRRPPTRRATRDGNGNWADSAGRGCGAGASAMLGRRGMPDAPPPAVRRMTTLPVGPSKDRADQHRLIAPCHGLLGWRNDAGVTLSRGRASEKRGCPRRGPNGFYPQTLVTFRTFDPDLAVKIHQHTSGLEVIERCPRLSPASGRRR